METDKLMENYSQASKDRQRDSRPDVNDPNVVDSLTRAAIRILTAQAEPDKRRKRWRQAG
jgi:hypothetical protein